MAYYDHDWNDGFSASLGYSHTKVSNLNFQTGDDSRVQFTVQYSFSSKDLLS